MKPRSDYVPSVTYKVPTNCGTMYVTVTIDEDSKPYEVFAYMGHTGLCTSAQINGLTVAISLGLRNDVPVQIFIEHLSQIKCDQKRFLGNKITISSCANAIAQVLEHASNDQRTLEWANEEWYRINEKNKSVRDKS